MMSLLFPLTVVFLRKSRGFSKLSTLPSSLDSVAILSKFYESDFEKSSPAEDFDC